MSVFHHPPFNRFVPWREDSDYRIAVVSSVGQGPKGDKGDSLTLNDLLAEPEKVKDLGNLLAEFGIHGKSAYEIAVSKGYEGTEAEWLASLKGDKGDTGDTGENGRAGTWSDASGTEKQAMMDYIAQQFAYLYLRKASGYYIFNSNSPLAVHWTGDNGPEFGCSLFPLEDFAWGSDGHTPDQTTLHNILTGDILPIINVYIDGLHLIQGLEYGIISYNDSLAISLNNNITHDATIQVDLIAGYFAVND